MLKVLISAPTGYNTREILLPLKNILEQDHDITTVQVITPAADYRANLFPSFGSKFEFIANKQNLAEYKTLFKANKPDIVITPTIGLDMRDTLILRAAKQLNIPTLTFIASWDNVFKMERLIKYGQDYELPNFFALWNRMMHTHLQEILPQYNESNIRITGAPRFDYYYHADKIPTKKDLFSYLRLDEAKDNKLIHGATTELYPFDYILAAIRQAINSGRINFPLTMYASVHPGGDIKKHNYASYGAITRYSFGRRTPVLHPDFAYLPTEEEIYLLVALFKHTDVLINQSSTVAIESMVAGRPVINVKYGRQFDWWNWYRSAVYRDFKQHYKYITEEGGTMIARSPKQLISYLNRYLENPGLEAEQRQKTVAKMITYTDGSASQRLVSYAKEIIQHK